MVWELKNLTQLEDMINVMIYIPKENKWKKGIISNYWTGESLKLEISGESSYITIQREDMEPYSGGLLLKDLNKIDVEGIKNKMEKGE